MGKWIHRLTNKDIKQRTAICSTCGSVNIRKAGQTWRCKIAYNAGRRGQKNINWEKPNVCLICKFDKPLIKDHNHKTGDFRGWICISCNNLLGVAKDNPQILKNAIKYLRCNLPPITFV